MSYSAECHRELIELIELQLEGRLSDAQFAELEQLLLTDADSRRVYREYVDLHGLLHWNLARGNDSAVDDSSTITTEELPGATGASVDTGRVVAGVVRTSGSDDSNGVAEAPIVGRRRLGRRRQASAIAACITCVAVLAFGVSRVDRPHRDDRNDVTGTATPRQNQLAELSNQQYRDDRMVAHGPAESIQPGQVSIADDDRGSATGGTVAGSGTSSESMLPDMVVSIESSNDHGSPSSTAAVVAVIDREIREGWSDNSVLPSSRASDAEWLRRVSLDVVGHIPRPARIREFLADKRADKRAIVIDELLDDEDYIRNWSTVWANLLIGRSNPRQVDRPALMKFLREAFAQNRGWDEIVADFIAAEGRHDENGATNFLLAHLNNQAVPATAVTARVFLGQQMQCLQCHDHPFNDKKQDEFWAFNSFFKQVSTESRMAGNDTQARTILRDIEEGGETFYETRNGLMRVALPAFEGQRINAAPEVKRRQELARLMTSGDSPQIARAFVNRIWEHFLGRPFTPVVDDMGPHANVSHPELLDYLTREFVRSGYDIKQLIRWVCQSEAYNITSQFNADNVADNPENGEQPLFSRAYVKRMTVEQLFDSLLIATDSRDAFGSNWDAVEQRRTEWLQQFVMAWGTDENDEADLFDGTITQALMLMNGDLIRLALESDHGTYLDRVAESDRSETEKIEAIALAALSRPPSRHEVTAVRKLIRSSATRSGLRIDDATATRIGLQDLFWACLNSNEFILIH